MRIHRNPLPVEAINIRIREVAPLPKINPHGHGATHHTVRQLRFDWPARILPESNTVDVNHQSRLRPLEAKPIQAGVDLIGLADTPGIGWCAKVHRHSCMNAAALLVSTDLHYARWTYRKTRRLVTGDAGQNVVSLDCASQAACCL